MAGYAVGVLAVPVVVGSAAPGPVGLILHQYYIKVERKQEEKSLEQTPL